MSFRWGTQEEVIKNRTAFLQNSHISLESCVSVGVHHGVSVERVDATHRGQGMAYGNTREMPEALVTNTPGVFLFLFTGDCLPIFCFDVRKNVAGLAHVSRHNVPKLLAQRMVEKMQEWCGSSPSDILAGIGPGVRKESYHFPKERCAGFVPEWKRFIEATTDGCAFDLPGWNAAQLAAAGVRKENIIIAPQDTVRDARFFSHVRSGRTGEKEGRFATVVGLRDIRP